VNRSASPPVQLADSSVPGSTDSLPRWEPGEHGSVSALGRIEVPLAPRQCCMHVGRSACPVDDLAPQNIGERMARKTIQLLRHTSTITNRRTTDTNCRQSVGGSFAAPDDNCAWTAAVPAGPASPCPAHRSPSCGIVVDGNATLRSAGGGHGVQAVNLEAGSRAPGRQGRAV
jgi:hypothetical protein